jgi:hypothetical protein
MEACIVRRSVWEDKEISGFFWFRSELGDALSEEDLESIVSYFMIVHSAWDRCFGKKTMRAPIFRFKKSPHNPEHLRIQMLRLSDESQMDAVMAEKAVHVSGSSLSLIHD